MLIICWRIDGRNHHIKPSVSVFLFALRVFLSLVSALISRFSACVKTCHRVSFTEASALTHLRFNFTSRQHFDRSFYHDKVLDSLLFGAKRHQFQHTKAQLKFSGTKTRFHKSFVASLRSKIQPGFRIFCLTH